MRRPPAPLHVGQSLSGFTWSHTFQSEFVYMSKPNKYSPFKDLGQNKQALNKWNKSEKTQPDPQMLEPGLAFTRTHLSKAARLVRWAHSPDRLYKHLT